jgi:hypothetical protein
MPGRFAVSRARRCLVMSASEDEMFARWQEWVPKINTSVVRLWYHREVWQQTRDLLTREHQRYGSDGIFLRAFSKMYVDSQAVALRRLADPGRDVVSFARLLRRMHKNPSVLSRERFLQTCEELAPEWSEDLARHQNEIYDRYARSGGDELDRSLLERDLGQLYSDASKVVKFANKTVAHLDRRPFEGEVTYGELARVVDDVTALWRRYYWLITGADEAWPPSIAGDPVAPFRVALDARGSSTPSPAPAGRPTALEVGMAGARGLLTAANGVTNTLARLLRCPLRGS